MKKSKWCKMLDFPSDIIKIELPGTSENQTVMIPQNELFRVHNIFEKHEYAIPPIYLPSGPLTIIDIGANVGLFALYMKQIRLDCKIYCFEPAPPTICLLKKNTAFHNEIHIYPYALSDQDAMAELNIHAFNSGENSFKYGKKAADQLIQVEVKNAAMTLQQIGLTYIDVLKIDTEGCEVEILRSLGPYLPYVGIVMAEYHSEQDRRTIDGILSQHTLFEANINMTQLGVVKYINSRLL